MEMRQLEEDEDAPVVRETHVFVSAKGTLKTIFGIGAVALAIIWALNPDRVEILGVALLIFVVAYAG